MYDLRSDTITTPSEKMRKAMYEAEVGDDVYSEDPAINRLQDRACELTGKDAALFVPSGSMGNLIPIYLLCGRGNEVIAHYQSHILHYEMTSLASLAGAMPVAVEGERGVYTPEEVEKHLRPDIYYMPKVRLLEIENTHNLAGGTCWKHDEIAAVGKIARRHGFSVHLDGARAFNAEVATGVRVRDMAEHVDSITFCLSKGLGAPVGSLLCGDRDFIAEARRVRKLLGGGMRQAGVLAAAGLYALDHNIDRLAEDHQNAKTLARALAATSWADIDPEKIETNILYFDTVDIAAGKVVGALREKGVLCGATASQTVRMVTSLEVDNTAIDEVARIISELRL